MFDRDKNHSQLYHAGCILDGLPALIQLNHKLGLWPKSEKVPETWSALERNGTIQDTSLPLAWQEEGPVGMHPIFLLFSYIPYFLTSFFPHQFDSGPQKPIFPLLLTFSGQFLHVLVSTGSGTDSPARSPCLILEIIPVSVLLQAEERRTVEKRRSDSDRGPESEHGRKVSGDPCPFWGTLVLEEETSRVCLLTSKSCLGPKGSSNVL